MMPRKARNDSMKMSKNLNCSVVSQIDDRFLVFGVEAVPAAR